MNIDASSLIPSIDSFQFYIPLTSTPKRSTKCLNCQPLSSTLSMSNDSYKQFDLSISAITSPGKQHRSSRRRHPSSIIKRIELKYLLYSTRTMKYNKQQRQYTDTERKIYVV